MRLIRDEKRRLAAPMGSWGASGMEGNVSQPTFLLVAAVVFLLIAVGHLVRVAFGAALVMADVAIPMWPSLLAVVVMGYLAFEGFRLRCKHK